MQIAVYNKIDNNSKNNNRLHFLNAHFVKYFNLIFINAIFIISIQTLESVCAHIVAQTLISTLQLLHLSLDHSTN